MDIWLAINGNNVRLGIDYRGTESSPTRPTIPSVIVTLIQV